MHRLRLLLRDFWSIAIPFWSSDERWQARGLLGAIVVLNLVLVGTALMFTVWQGAFFNALVRKDWGDFIALLLWWRYTQSEGFVAGFALNAAILVPATVYANYLQQALQIRWRRWHTDRCTDAWLSHHAYYRIELTEPSTDNPDQRISEDVRLFVDNAHFGDRYAACFGDADLVRVRALGAVRPI
jgi:vitamin B12/bleomycin/antimicrobial peptide transport system ATP-binding/permease protein